MEALIHHFKLYTEGYPRAGRRGLRRRSRRRRASSASTWSPTAPTSPIAARSARRASPICRPWTSCRKGHMLADVRGDHRLHGYRVRGDRPMSETRKPARRSPSRAENLDARRPSSPSIRKASAPAPCCRCSTWRSARTTTGVAPAIDYVAELSGMPPIRVYEVATFYTMFNTKPVGRHNTIQVCTTTPCWLRGSDDLVRPARTSSASASSARPPKTASSRCVEVCLGACVNAPMMQINDDDY